MNEIPRECAWCCKETGQTPNKNGTHGLCERHFREMMKPLLNSIEIDLRVQKIYLEQKTFCPDLSENLTKL
jgi:hypothetical protein